MIRMKKRSIFYTALVVLLIAVVGFYFTGANFQKTEILQRTVALNENAIDYQAVFNGFGDAELLIDEENNTIKFSGSQTIDSSIFEEFDLVNSSDLDENKGLDVRYIFDYNADLNEFRLSVIADTDNGEIIDDWFGVPFIDETGETDIAFSTDEGIIHLSDLEGSGVLNNCGWFSKLFKKIAIIAAVVVAVALVVAIVVVAAPAVAAAGTAVGAAVSVGGGAAALAGGTATAAVAAAAAAGAAAMATTAFAVATTTAVVAAAIAVSAGVSRLISDRVYANLQEKVEDTVRELKKNKEYQGTIIFRAGSNTVSNLTPKEKDITSGGLSFFNNYYQMSLTLVFTKVCITTIEIVNSIGTLRAVKDGTHHISIKPTDGNLLEWIASRYSSIPDMRTTCLQNAVAVV